MSKRENGIHSFRAEPTDDGVRASREQHTIHDVARLAGVSIGTASKALNANGRLSAETRAKVLSVGKAIDYRPNDVAQSLHRARSMTVGILTTDSFHRFGFPIVATIERRLFDEGVAVFLCNATDDPSHERRHIDQLLAKRGDRQEAIEPAVRGLPVVYVFSRVEHPEAFCLLPDDQGGAKLAVRHLVALGRSRIASITGPQRFEAVRLRDEGYRAAVAEAGPPARAFLPGRWSKARGRGAVQKLFARRKGAPDALFCGDDQIAGGAIEALREMGLTAPADVAVVGFDNWDVMAEATRPRLTSVDMNLQALGPDAGSALPDMMAGGHFAGVRRPPCSLVVRGSWGGNPSDVTERQS